MYLVVSVLPSSTTSGGWVPASAASSLVRWSGQFWYSTLTAVFGCLALNAVVAESTASGHPCWASVCSHTVMDAGSAALLLLVPPDPPLPQAASASAASAATGTSFIRSTEPPRPGHHPHWCRPLPE